MLSFKHRGLNMMFSGKYKCTAKRTAQEGFMPINLLSDVNFIWIRNVESACSEFL